MKIIKSIGFIALFFGLYTSAWATIWHVPSQCPNIQAGIDSALTGDTVLVADGTYTGEGNYNIDFLGKAILVTSENGPDTTIIDCEEISMHRAFIFQNGETSSSVLRGFTIQYGSHDEGGNIYCTNSSPTIEGNIIRTGCCMAGLGGGIYCDGTSSSLIADNIFELNYAQGGGAILCTDSAAPTIINNLFLSNNSLMGGGVFCNLSSSPSIMNSTFTSNGATSAGGAIWVFTSGSPPTVTNCILWDNLAPSGPEIWIQGGSAVVTYSDVEGGWSGDGNINSDPLFVSGPGSFSDYYLSQTAAGQPEQSPCVDAGDTSFIVPEVKTTRTDRYPDEWPIDMGYHYVSNYAPDLVDTPDTSIAENQYLTFTLEASDPDDDSIVFSSPNLPAGATLDSATGVFEWTPTTGQAGEYTITFIATDDGTPPLADTEYTDITVTSPGVEEEEKESLSPYLFQNYPNPFVSTTIIKYSVIAPTHITLSIYNICGELVWRLVNENQGTGLYEVIWDGCDHQGYKLPSGVYFCYFEADEFKNTSRMLIMRK
jgi:hypothetical protein